MQRRLFLSALPLLAQQYPPTFEGAITETYKQVGDVNLRLWIFNPPGHTAAKPRPAIVFFFGGGWTNGTPAQFQHHAQLLASRGMVAITADYRVASRHQVLAEQCVRDAKAAVRYLRQNAKRLGISPTRLAAGGGSAGGHLAAATATVPGFEDPSAVSSRPNALVLFNPALYLINSPEVPLAKRFGVPPETVSPFHQLQAGAPPTIIFHGEADTTVPYRTVEQYRDKAEYLGARCELIGYPGQGHGFFNHGRNNNEFYDKTTARMLKFLSSLGYLPA